MPKMNMPITRTNQPKLFLREPAFTMVASREPIKIPTMARAVKRPKKDQSIE